LQRASGFAKEGKIVPYDAEFHAFQQLAKLAERLLPGVRNYTVDQCNALHQYATILARDLTSGEYAYNTERHKKKE
jgi:hypothetical protein